MGLPIGKNGPGMARSVASQARREVHYTDPDTGQKYRDATNYVYACALECALRDAPKTNRWWDHEYSEEKAGDMIEIILGLAWMDKGRTLELLAWRGAVEDLVRKTEKLVSITRRTHHRYFAQRVKQALLRINLARQRPVWQGFDLSLGKPKDKAKHRPVFRWQT